MKPEPRTPSPTHLLSKKKTLKHICICVVLFGSVCVCLGLCGSVLE